MPDRYADAGNKAHYMVRWVSTTGEKERLPLTGRCGPTPPSRSDEAWPQVEGRAKR